MCVDSLFSFRDCGARSTSAFYRFLATMFVSFQAVRFLRFKVLHREAQLETKYAI